VIGIIIKQLGRAYEVFMMGISILSCLLFGVFGIRAVYIYCTTARVCVDERTVARVGGCDMFGVCGVAFRDGTYGQTTRPTPGQKVCLKKAVPPDTLEISTQH
jgi:hypothetical protein